MHGTLQVVDLQIVKAMHKSQNCASTQKADNQGVLIAPKSGLHKYILSQGWDGCKLFAQTAALGVGGVDFCGSEEALGVWIYAREDEGEGLDIGIGEAEFGLSELGKKAACGLVDKSDEAFDFTLRSEVNASSADAVVGPSFGGVVGRNFGQRLTKSVERVDAGGDCCGQVAAEGRVFAA